jgi:LCP family protein required for cell wall assembly
MRVPSWLFFGGIVMLVVATVVCGFGSFALARQLAVDLGESGIRVASFQEFLQVQPTPTLIPTLSPAEPTPEAETVSDNPPPEPQSEPTATLDPLAGYSWDDPRRFNVLLLGIDQRGDEDGPFRTDTMIVVSIDPVRKTVGMLSIPRDLWVPIPGFQPGRINTANALGDANAYPGGGPALAARTITENLGIPIDRYVRINFDVFTTVISLIAPNGIEVCPRELIDDPTYPDAGYGTIYVRFEPGCQRLDAERLLQYARTRATEGSDFDRAARQQEVIKAVRDEVLSAGGITNFIGQLPALWDQLSGAYVTNLSLEDIIALGLLLQEVPRENITSGVINNLYVDLAMTSSGDQVLLPRYNAIRFLMDQVFNAQTNISLSDLRTRAQAENAEIVVYNNTDIPGLAGQTRDWLLSQQVTVQSIGNIPTPNNRPTYIRDYTGRLWTARYLAALLGLPADAIEPGADGLTTADTMVVVGPDIQALLGE